MSYILPCDQPDFRQGVPSEGKWVQLPKARTGSGNYEYRNAATGETVLVPAVWYNQTPAQYAETLLWNADRADENAARKANESKPWSASDAARIRAMAADLRRKASLYAASRANTAGHAGIS